LSFSGYCNLPTSSPCETPNIRIFLSVGCCRGTIDPPSANATKKQNKQHNEKENFFIPLFNFYLLVFRRSLHSITDTTTIGKLTNESFASAKFDSIQNTTLG